MLLHRRRRGRRGRRRGRRPGAVRDDPKVPSRRRVAAPAPLAHDRGRRGRQRRQRRGRARRGRKRRPLLLLLLLVVQQRLALGGALLRRHAADGRGPRGRARGGALLALQRLGVARARRRRRAGGGAGGARAHGRAEAERAGGAEVAEHVRVGGGGGLVLVDPVEHLGGGGARVGGGLEQAALLEDAGDELCAKIRRAVRRARPQDRARHAVVAKRHAHLLARKAEHPRHRLLAAAQRLVHVRGVAAGALDELGAHLVVEDAAHVGHHSVGAHVLADGELHVRQPARLRDRGDHVQKRLLGPVVPDPVVDQGHAGPVVGVHARRLFIPNPLRTVLIPHDN